MMPFTIENERVNGMTGPTSALESITSAELMPQPLGLPFPAELINILAENMDREILAFRLTCKAIATATLPAFGQYLSRSKKLYPTVPSTTHWRLIANSRLAIYIKQLHIVGQTLRSHPLGYAWAWEHAEHINDHHFATDQDRALIAAINASHHPVAAQSQLLIATGEYRAALTEVLTKMPHLRKIFVQPLLHPGEHIPGWRGVELVPQLSGDCRKLDLREPLYGDYQYDEEHRAVTVWEDEFGDEVWSVPQIGEQARFDDDFWAAVRESNVLGWKKTSEE